MNGYYKAVTEQLRLHRFDLLRQGKGSHEIWSNGRRHVTVSVTCQSRFTANAIMKQAGIDHRF